VAQRPDVDRPRGPAGRLEALGGRDLPARQREVRLAAMTAAAMAPLRQALPSAETHYPNNLLAATSSTAARARFDATSAPTTMAGSTPTGPMAHQVTATSPMTRL
jgi:hypothetical protein